MGFQGPQGPAAPVTAITRFAAGVGNLGSVVAPTGLLLPYAFNSTVDAGNADSAQFPPESYWQALAQSLPIARAITFSNLIISAGVNPRSGVSPSPAVTFSVGLHVTGDPLIPGTPVFTQTIFLGATISTIFAQVLAAVSISLLPGQYLMVSVAPDVDLSIITPNYWIDVTLM